MSFGYYADVSAALMVELVNSHDPRRDPPEGLPDVVAVTDFLRRHRMLGANTVSEGDVDSMHRLREEMRAIFEANTDEAVPLVNALLARAGVTPWIRPNADGTRNLFFADPQAPLAQRVACDAGIGLAMLMVEHADRLKVCAAEGCRNVLVDASRNRCRRWCSDTCGARTNVAAYRERCRAQGH